MPEPVNTNLVPGPVNTNLVPGPVNTNWEPGPGARGQGKGRGPEIQIPDFGFLFTIMKKTYDLL